MRTNFFLPLKGNVFPFKNQSGTGFKTIINILVLFIFVSLIWACKKVEDATLQAPAKTEPAKPQTVYPSTDKVGIGTDLATGEAGGVGTPKGMVINIVALYDDWPARIIFENISKQETEVIAAENIYNYTKSKSGKIKVSSGFGLFKSYIYYTDSSSYRSDFIYSSYTLFIKQNRIQLNASAELLKKYLTKEFQADLLYMSPAQLVSHYGTAVIIDEIRGGKFTALYRSRTENSDKNGAASAGLSGAIKNWFDIDISGGQNKAAAATNTSQQLYFSTTGGYSSIPLIGEIDLGNTVPKKIQLTTWQQSVVPANSVMIDFGSSDGAISLADLVPESKAAALRAYIAQYYREHEIKMIDPPSVVYGYYDNINADWAYSLKNEPTLDGRLIRSGPVFRAYPKKTDQTSAIYAFYNAALGDYMYSPDPAKIPSGYTNNGVAFYAPIQSISGATPIFEFLYHAKINKRIYYSHYYSTVNQLPGTIDWAYTSLPFYAYPL